MLIPMELVLGLACTFYVLVAIRWRREVMAIRREGRRASSAMAPFPTSAAEKITVLNAAVNSQTTASGSASREVIVMKQSNAGKHQRQVVA
jgi:hypothetical protein